MVTLALVAVVYLLQWRLAGVLLAYLVGKTVSALGLSLHRAGRSRPSLG